MPHGGQEGGGVLPNGGGREQRERLQSFSSPLFSSCLFFHSKLSPSFCFPAPSPLFKKLFPLFSKTLPPPFAAASKGSGAATCAWGAGDTKPGQPALLPCLRCSPLLRVSGSGMHMGGTVSTLFWFFFFFSFYFFIFVGIQKWVTTMLLDNIYADYYPCYDKA